MALTRRGERIFGLARRGTILILTALLLTVLMGITALAIDFGYAADYRHRMQSAADAAAVAGAREMKRLPAISYGDLQTFVFHDAATNGFTNGVDGIVITVNRGPATGAHAGDDNFVEVLITRPMPTFFLPIFGRSTLNVGTRAVAGYEGGSAGCIYALGDGQGVIQTASTAEIRVPDCDIYVNSPDGKAMVTGDATIEAHAINVVGGLGGSPDKTNFIIDGDPNALPTTGADAVVDPYLDTPVPTAGTCTTFSIPSSSTVLVTLSPGTYCQDIVIQNAVVHFEPGLYVLKDAALNIGGNTSVVTGAGVTFFSVGTVLHTTIIDSGTDVTLSAPETGTYATILFASLMVGASVGNRLQSDNMSLEGVIYFPHMHLEFKGNSGAAYTILVVDNVKFSGNSSLSVNLATMPGGSIPGDVFKAE